MIAVDDKDELVRHIQVVAGNRSLNGAAQAFRIDAIQVEGLTEPITLAVALGESEKSVEELVGAKSEGKTEVTDELVQESIFRALATGNKTRAFLDAVCKDERGVSPNRSTSAGSLRSARRSGSGRTRTASRVAGTTA